MSTVASRKKKQQMMKESSNYSDSNNVGKKDVRDNKSRTSNNSLSQAIMLGLISSSCCVIQLVINMLSFYFGIMNGFGCAGFNTILGPLRPVTRFLTLVWLIWNWIVAPSSSGCCIDTVGNDTPAHDGSKKRKLRNSRPILESCLCLVLMLSPEMVTLYGNYRSNGEVLPSYSKWRNLSKDGHAKTDQLLRVNYVVDNMGCEACINAVERLIRKQEGVVKSTVVSFESGEVEIYLKTDDDDEEWNGGVQKKSFEENLDKILRNNGYELHDMGWVTKKMKMNKKIKSNNNLFSLGAGGDL